MNLVSSNRNKKHTHTQENLRLRNKNQLQTFQTSFKFLLSMVFQTFHLIQNYRAKRKEKNKQNDENEKTNKETNKNAIKLIKNHSNNKNQNYFWKINFRFDARTNNNFIQNECISNRNSFTRFYFIFFYKIRQNNFIKFFF